MALTKKEKIENGVEEKGCYRVLYVGSQWVVDEVVGTYLELYRYDRGTKKETTALISDVLVR